MGGMIGGQIGGDQNAAKTVQVVALPNSATSNQNQINLISTMKLQVKTGEFSSETLGHT